jgi:hypothetical protein
MTQADHERAENLRRAIYHHEIGHVRVAEAVRDALGREGFDRFKREERSYDESTNHGRRQHLAPGDLAGPDTIIRCA